MLDSAVIHLMRLFREGLDREQAVRFISSVAVYASSVASANQVCSVHPTDDDLKEIERRIRTTYEVRGVEVRRALFEAGQRYPLIDSFSEKDISLMEWCVLTASKGFKADDAGQAAACDLLKRMQRARGVCVNCGAKPPGHEGACT